MITTQALSLMDDGHLIASLHADMDSLTSTPVERELLKRFEEAVSDEALVSACDDNGFTVEDIKRFGGLPISPLDLVPMLESLAEAEIFDVDDWGPCRALLDALADAGIDDVIELNRRLKPRLIQKE